MPRTKNAKRPAKRQAKQQKSSAPRSNLQTMQNDFIKVPAKLAANLDKEINALAKKEAKLTKIVAKTETQIKKLEARAKSSTQANQTATGKKQFKVVKRALATAVKEQTVSTKQLQKITQLLNQSLQQQAKFIALDKALNQFEKDWVKQVKQMNTKAKAKMKPAASKAKKPSATEAPKSNFDDMIEDQTDVADTETDVADESMEIAS